VPTKKKKRLRRKRSLVHRALVAWDQHEETRRHQAFYRTFTFKIWVVCGLFLAAIVLKGEHFTTTVLVARVADAIGDVITDRAFGH
jgi:hypothetical protein